MGYVRSGERQVSTQELLDRASRAATGLASLGVSRGDTIALFLRNDIAMFEASVAAGMLGAYVVPVNWHYFADELQYLLSDSGARILVIHADLVEQVRGALPDDLTVLVVATPPEIQDAYAIRADACAVHPGVTDWDDWVQRHPPYRGEIPPSPGMIIYTSGTTGRPKGVRRLSPTSVQAATSQRILRRAFRFDRFEDRPQDIVTVVTGPMYHSGPNIYAMVGLRMGASIILQPRFDAEELLQIISAERVTHLNMVPVMFNRLLKLPDETRKSSDVSSLVSVIHAAAPCPPAVKNAMIDWWGPVIDEYFGSTETGMVAFCSSQEWLEHPGTVGRPLPETRLLIVDEQGNPMPQGGVGEVLVSSPEIADWTYHGNEEKRRAVTKGGMVATGDVGFLDQDGFMHLCGRANDMIISGGVNIYPAEIEAELLKVPGVADSAVFGIPDDEFGEAVCAAIQPSPGVDLSEAGIKASLRGKVAGYKIPKKVVILEDLPREDSGKVFKRILRDPFWEGTGRNI